MRVDWSDYCRVHTTRANLLIHLFAVPVFVVTFVCLLRYLVLGDGWAATMFLTFAIFAMAMEGYGHKREHNPPRPFTGPVNFLQRWFTEQFIVFPLFLLSGRWWQQWRTATRHESS